MSIKEKAQKRLSAVLTDEVQAILVHGIEEGIEIYRRLSEERVEQLGFYAQNSQTRDIFSALCHGLEETIKRARSLTLRFEQRHITSSYFLEIRNANMVIHVRNENSRMPSYMLNACEQNKGFRSDKPLYCVIAFSGRNGKVVSSVDIVVYDANGREAYRKALSLLISNLNAA